MTDEGRGQDPHGQLPNTERPRAVVVAVDPARLTLYARTLRLADVPNLATLDLDEAEQLLIEHQPSVLVLDYGLPRVYILRLYGLVREGMGRPHIKVLFVGQAGDAGSDGGGAEGADDYYLPGEPSPLGVAAQVCEMVADAGAPSAAMAATPGAPDVQSPLLDAARAGSADRPKGDISAPAPEPALAGVAAAGSANVPGDEASSDAPPVAPKKGRRLDVLMFRIGMVLLILGGLLAFIRPESFTLPMSAPPTLVPAQPTQPPTASPSPAAYLFPDTGLVGRFDQEPNASIVAATHGRPSHF